MIFAIENWLWKSYFGTFWHLPTTPIRKIQNFPLSMLIFSQKHFFNFVFLLWKLHNRYCHTLEVASLAQWFVAIVWKGLENQTSNSPIYPFHVDFYQKQVLVYLVLMMRSTWKNNQIHIKTCFSLLTNLTILFEYSYKYF